MHIRTKPQPYSLHSTKDNPIPIFAQRMFKDHIFWPQITKNLCKTEAIFSTALTAYSHLCWYTLIHHGLLQSNRDQGLRIKAHSVYEKYSCNAGIRCASLDVWHLTQV